MAEFRIDDAGEPSSIPTWFERWAEVEQAADLTFVLPESDLRASGLVLLAAMAASRRHRGLSSRVGGSDPPDSEAVSALFLDRGRFIRRRTNAARQTLRSIDTHTAARRIAEDAAANLEQSELPISPSVVRLARFVFEELAANVVDHSQRPDTGYGFVRVDPDSHRFELAFADAGVGFRASLQRNPDLEGRVSDDAEALQIALTPRVSGTVAPRKNMGIGLGKLTEFSDLLGGDLWIASGSAMLQRKTTAGQRTNVIRSIPPWQGTWICLDAPVS